MALFGVDLGTYHIDAAIFQNNQITQVKLDGEESITSSVFVSDRLYFGKAALEKGRIKPQLLLRNIKRLIGRDTTYIANELQGNGHFRVVRDGDVDVVEVVGTNIRYPLLSIVVELLRFVVESAREMASDIRLMVLSYPPSWNENQKAIYKQCAEQLGIPCCLVTETVASALNTGFHPEKHPINLLVVDGGGGTFDVTSMVITKEKGYEVIVTDGLRISGYDCTERVLKDMEQQLHILDVLSDGETLSPRDRAELWSQAEDTKINLSDHDEYSVDVIVKHESQTLVYTRQSLENLCQPLLEQSLRKVSDVIQEAEKKGYRPTTCLLCGQGLKMACYQDGVSGFFSENDVYRTLSCSVSRGAVMYGRTIKTLPVVGRGSGSITRPIAVVPMNSGSSGYSGNTGDFGNAGNAGNAGSTGAPGNSINPTTPTPSPFPPLEIPPFPISPNTLPQPLPPANTFEPKELPVLPPLTVIPPVHEKRTFTLYMSKGRMTKDAPDLRPMVKTSDELPCTKKCNWTLQANKPFIVKLFEGREPFQDRCRCIRVLELARDEKHPLKQNAQFTSYVHADATGSVSMTFNWRDTEDEIQVINDYSPDRIGVIPRQVELPTTHTRPPIMTLMSMLPLSDPLNPTLLPGLTVPPHSVRHHPEVPVVPEVPPAISEVLPAVSEELPTIPEMPRIIPEVPRIIPEVPPTIPEVPRIIPEVPPTIPDMSPNIIPVSLPNYPLFPLPEI